jgi:hypothetical protein
VQTCAVRSRAVCVNVACPARVAAQRNVRCSNDAERPYLKVQMIVDMLKKERLLCHLLPTLIILA